MSTIYRRKSAATGSVELEFDVEKLEEVEKELGKLGEKVQQIKVLTSRLSELTHYRAFDDIEFVIEAIGSKEYPGSPALDVLPSNGDVDRERKEKVKDYIYCLNSWADGKTLEDAIGEFKTSENLLRSMYVHLGELDEEKKWLALCLVENLNKKAFSPEDVVYEISDEDFVLHAYRTILGRDPDRDDLKIKLLELERGKTRQEIITNILECKESNRKMLAKIANSIRTSKPD